MPKCAPEDLPGGVWAAWGPLGALLGRSWVVLGLARSGRLLERSWGLLGRSWGLPGRAWGSFGPPEGLLVGLLGPLLKAPLRNRENLEIDDSTALLEVSRGPGGSRIGLESGRNRSQARLGASGGLWRLRGAVLSLSGPLRGPSAWLLGRPWVAPDRSELTGTRGPYITSSPKTV